MATSDATTRRTPGPLVILAASVTVVTWASAFVGIRAAVVVYSPAHMALLRYLVASLVLAIYAPLVRMSLPRWRHLPGLAAIGLIGIAFYNISLGYGEVAIPAATASFLTASVPVWIALLASLAFHERLSAWGWLGTAVSLAGVAAITLRSGTGLQIDPRALAVLAAALASALCSLGQKFYLGRYSALQCTACVIWSGTLFLLPFAGGLPARIAAAPPSATLAIVYMGVAPGALGYLTWAYVLARLPASIAGSLLYLIPVLVMLIGWVWLREVPAPLSLLGGLLVLAGVVVVNRWGKQSV